MAKNNGSKTTLIIIAVILGILLIGGIVVGFGYYVYKGYIEGENKYGPNEPYPTDLTLGWKEYTNSRYGFYLKYPSTFTAHESQNGDGITLTQNDPAMTIRAFGSSNALSQTLDEYLNWVRGNLFKEQESAEEILAEEIPLGAGNLPAQERQWKYVNSVDGSLTLMDQVTTLQDDTFYTIEMVVANSNYDEYTAHFFDNILSSFKINK